MEGNSTPARQPQKLQSPQDVCAPQGAVCEHPVHRRPAVEDRVDFARELFESCVAQAEAGVAEISLEQLDSSLLGRLKPAPPKCVEAGFSRPDFGLTRHTKVADVVSRSS